MRKKAVAAVGVAFALLATTACGDSGGSGDSGSDGAQASSAPAGPIKVGYLTSFSGPNSASFSKGLTAAEARLKAYQEAGGECADRQIELVEGDDTSNAQGALGAAQKLVQQDEVFAMISASSFFFGAAQYMTTQAKETPVLASGFDGSPQYQNHPETNLLPYFPIPDFENAYGVTGEYLKAAGATKVAGVGFNSPSSQKGLELAMKSAEAAGLTRGYVNDSVAFGSKDVGPLVLGIMSSGADSLYLAITPDTGLAVIAGLRQAGWKGKTIISAAGYGDLLASPQAVQLAQGVTFTTVWAPIELETEATKMESEALKKHAGVTTGVPGFAQSLGWLSMDLFLHGLEKAGCDADQATFLETLRTDDTWDAGGLYPNPVDFGVVRSEEQCQYYPVLKGNTYELDGKEPICGSTL